MSGLTLPSPGTSPDPSGSSTGIGQSAATDRRPRRQNPHSPHYGSCSLVGEASRVGRAAACGTGDLLNTPECQATTSHLGATAAAGSPGKVGHFGQIRQDSGRTSGNVRALRCGTGRQPKTAFDTPECQCDHYPTSVHADATVTELASKAVKVGMGCDKSLIIDQATSRWPRATATRRGFQGLLGLALLEHTAKIGRMNHGAAHLSRHALAPST
jgi:hypothetical protein